MVVQADESQRESDQQADGICHTSTSSLCHPWKRSHNTDEHTKKSARNMKGMGIGMGEMGESLGLPMLETVQ